MKTCIYRQCSNKTSYCSSCDNYIRHDTRRFYNAKQDHLNRLKFNYCPNCGAKIIKRIKKEVNDDNKRAIGKVD